MRYEFSGSIWISNVGKRNAFSVVVNKLFDDEDKDVYEYYNKYLENLDFSSNSVDVYGSSSFDDMDAMKTIMMMICDKTISMYPDCSLEAHYCGTNMSTGDEWAFNVDYKNYHVKKYEIDGFNDRIYCPECDEGVVSIGSVCFNTNYKCDICGRIMTEEEIMSEISSCIEEYDVEAPPKTIEERANEPAVVIDFAGKKFVTTGLSIDDEKWVKEEVESRGGEFKPKFVVSLNYLIYNPDYDHETTKYTRAKEQIEKGKPVQIITFEQFKKSLLVN